MKFYRLEELYGELPVWKAVPEVERREIYVDVQHNLAKKEKEDAKALTKRNKKRLGEILDQVRPAGRSITSVRFVYLFESFFDPS